MDGIKIMTLPIYYLDNPSYTKSLFMSYGKLLFITVRF